MTDVKTTPVPQTFLMRLDYDELQVIVAMRQATYAAHERGKEKGNEKFRKDMRFILSKLAEVTQRNGIAPGDPPKEAS
ncbi:MAG: hypothetical protein AAGJ82_02895 [Bacteroidota bacterium]